MVQSDGTVEPGWSHFPHGADIGVEGHGPTMASAFEQAALALMTAITVARVEPKIKVDVICAAPDRELLFVEWLNVVIYEMSVRRMLFGRFAVQVADGKLTGILWGEPVDTMRHQPACEPKGATYTELHVAENAEGSWSARCVVDV